MTALLSVPKDRTSEEICMSEVSDKTEGVAEGGRVWHPPRVSPVVAAWKAFVGSRMVRGASSFVRLHPLLAAFIFFAPIATMMIMSALSLQETIRFINEAEEGVVSSVVQEYEYKSGSVG